MKKISLLLLFLLVICTSSRLSLAMIENLATIEKEEEEKVEEKVAGTNYAEQREAEAIKYLKNTLTNEQFSTGGTFATEDHTEDNKPIEDGFIIDSLISGPLATDDAIQAFLILLEVKIEEVESDREHFRNKLRNVKELTKEERTELSKSVDSHLKHWRGESEKYGQKYKKYRSKVNAGNGNDNDSELKKALKGFLAKVGGFPKAKGLIGLLEEIKEQISEIESERIKETKEEVVVNNKLRECTRVLDSSRNSVECLNETLDKSPETEILLGEAKKYLNDVDLKLGSSKRKLELLEEEPTDSAVKKTDYYARIYHHLKNLAKFTTAVMSVTAAYVEYINYSSKFNNPGVIQGGQGNITITPGFYDPYPNNGNYTYIDLTKPGNSGGLNLFQNKEGPISEQKSDNYLSKFNNPGVIQGGQGNITITPGFYDPYPNNGNYTYIDLTKPGNSGGLNLFQNKEGTTSEQKSDNYPSKFNNPGVIKGDQGYTTTILDPYLDLYKKDISGYTISIHIPNTDNSSDLNVQKNVIDPIEKDKHESVKDLQRTGSEPEKKEAPSVLREEQGKSQSEPFAEQESTGKNNNEPGSEWSTNRKLSTTAAVIGTVVGAGLLTGRRRQEYIPNGNTSDSDHESVGSDNESVNSVGR